MKPAMVGQTLAHYKVLEKLGSGGMGDVYVAEDTKLGRKVALKVLPPEMATDERLSRFEREAKAVAALNHPNIVTVYSVEHMDGVHFITMELVLGKTLSELIPKKGFPLNRFFELAIPLADAVSAAHHHGVVHRDLKPDNLMQDQEQRLKILDFGLAKWHQASSSNRTAGHAGSNTYPSWSPDGRQIAFLSNTHELNLSVVPALGGMPRTIVSWPQDELTVFGSPWRWSPDGAELAFGGQDEEGPMIGVLSVATGERVRRLPARVREANKILDLSWSPDGSFFAYVDALNDFATLTGVSVLRASDGETIPVTHGRWTDWSPTWSSDSRTLFFVSNRGGSNDLWQQALGPDGKPVGDPQPVTTAVGMRRVALSPDGKKLAYSKGREVASVWRVPIFSDRPATWSDAMQITFDEALIEFIDISPDGERLAVSSDRAGNHDLWVLPAAGGEMQPLTTDPTPDWFPRWSPDGKQIAFYAYRSGNRDIWVMPAGGRRARQLTTHEAFDAGPAWSPDGKTLAFMSARLGSDDIWTIPSDGGEPLRLTDDPGSEWSLSWSFDGEHIVFASITGGTSAGLWRLPASGGEPSPLTPVSDGTHILSRSRNEIFHHSTRNGSRNVWAIPAGGGRERQLTDFTGRNGNLRVNGLATDGEYLYFVWSEDLGDIWVMDVARDSGAS